jgi:hypothetical protein
MQAIRSDLDMHRVAWGFQPPLDDIKGCWPVAEIGIAKAIGGRYLRHRWRSGRAALPVEGGGVIDVSHGSFAWNQANPSISLQFRMSASIRILPALVLSFWSRLWPQTLGFPQNIAKLSPSSQLRAKSLLRTGTNPKSPAPAG